MGSDPAAFTGRRPKIVLHTTEGSTAAGVIAAYSATGAWPHFTNLTDRALPAPPDLTRSQGARTPGGTCETNRTNCVQIEMVGFTKDTRNWPASYLSGIKQLCRWIEGNYGVPSKANVEFTATSRRQARRLTCGQWDAYAGYCGQEHVPNNHHWDPGDVPDRQDPRPLAATGGEREAETVAGARTEGVLGPGRAFQPAEIGPAGEDKEKVRQARHVVVDYAAKCER